MAALDRLPLDRISEQAREIHFARTVLTVVTGLFWLAGWATAKALGLLWYAAAWAAAAAKTGWVDARAGDG